MRHGVSLTLSKKDRVFDVSGIALCRNAERKKSSEEKGISNITFVIALPYVWLCRPDLGSPHCRSLRMVSRFPSATENHASAHEDAWRKVFFFEGNYQLIQTNKSFSPPPPPPPLSMFFQGSGHCHWPTLFGSNDASVRIQICTADTTVPPIRSSPRLVPFLSAPKEWKKECSWTSADLNLYHQSFQ